MPAPLTGGFLHAALDALGPTGALAAVRDDHGIIDFRWVYANKAITERLTDPLRLAAGEMLSVTMPDTVADELITAGRAAVNQNEPSSLQVSWPVGPTSIETDVRLTPFGDGVLIELSATSLEDPAIAVERLASQRARVMIDALLDPCVLLDVRRDPAFEGGVALTCIDANDAACAFHHVAREQLIGSDFTEWDIGIVRALPLIAVAEGSGPMTLEDFEANDADGTPRRFDVRGARANHGVSFTWRDVTLRHTIAVALSEAEERFRLAMENAVEGICLLAPDGRLLDVNPSLCEMLDRTATDLRSRAWQELTHPEDLALDTPLFQDVLAGRRDRYRTQKRFITSSGTTVWAILSVAAVRDDAGRVRYLIAQITDVTERVRAEEQLAVQATHDQLTGLANRLELDNELERALASANRSGRHVAVLVMDLDRFKFVNDSLGHHAGDELIRAAADRLRDTVRGGDLIVRTGGDEFIVVMRDLDRPSDALQGAWRIVEAFRRPITIAGTDLHTTISVGVATTKDGSSDSDLIVHADAAMYVAKDAGRDTVGVFDDELRDATRRRVEVEAQLRDAISDGNLDVWYQPEVSITNGSITACEALLRWHHPSGAVWNADRFIDVAEDTGLIVEIGTWVFRRVCEQSARWNERWPDHPIAVRTNFSARQLDTSGLLGAIDATLDTTLADPQQICAEITETAMLRGTSTVASNLDGIHRRGFTIASDDFGTGYASLVQLRAYPITHVKIDRSFVVDLTTDRQSRDLTAGTIALAARLGLGVTAEGVETVEQADLLIELGCDNAQGYLYSPAVPADEFEQLVEASRTAAGSDQQQPV